MNIDEMTIGQARKVMEFFVKNHEEPVNTGVKFSWVGKRVFIRRAGAYHYLGLVVDISESEIILTRAAWVADSMYHADFCKNGIGVNGVEIEPFLQDACVSVPRNNSEISEWCHDLPTEPIR